jgi:hypothetical protein
MRPDVQIVLATLLISILITHAWWVRFRVWMLRQDLFAIRDDLWMSMQAQGRLDDPDHQMAREVIQTMIRLAPSISVIFILRGLVEWAESRASGASRDPSIARSGVPEVDLAMSRASQRVARYLTRQTLTGLLMFVTFALGTRLIRVPMSVASRFFTWAVECVLPNATVRATADSLPESALIGSI